MAQTNAQTDKLIRFSLLLILTGLDGIPFRRKIKEFRHKVNFVIWNLLTLTARLDVFPERFIYSTFEVIMSSLNF